MSDLEAVAMACEEAIARTRSGSVDPDRCVLALRIALAHAERWQHARHMERMNERSPIMPRATTGKVRGRGGKGGWVLP